MSLIEIMRLTGPGGGRRQKERESFSVRNINNISFYGYTLETESD